MYDFAAAAAVVVVVVVGGGGAVGKVVVFGELFLFLGWLL